MCKKKTSRYSDLHTNHTQHVAMHAGSLLIQNHEKKESPKATAIMDEQYHSAESNFSAIYSVGVFPKASLKHLEK